MLELSPSEVGVPNARALVSALAAARLCEFDACVGADDAVIVAMATKLAVSGVPEVRWPVMVGFEGLAQAAPYVLSSVRPDWEGLGVNAADALLALACGRRTRGNAVSLASMTVVTPRR